MSMAETTKTMRNVAALRAAVAAGTFREDLLFDAAQVIESRCPPITPIDPRG